MRVDRQEFGRPVGERLNITPPLRHFGQADNLPLSLEIPTHRPACNRLVIEVLSAPDSAQSDSPP
jgi:hypothetical protein